MKNAAHRCPRPALAVPACRSRRRARTGGARRGRAHHPHRAGADPGVRRGPGGRLRQEDRVRRAHGLRAAAQPAGHLPPHSQPGDPRPHGLPRRRRVPGGPHDGPPPGRLPPRGPDRLPRALRGVRPPGDGDGRRRGPGGVHLGVHRRAVRRERPGVRGGAVRARGGAGAAPGGAGRGARERHGGSRGARTARPGGGLARARAALRGGPARRGASRRPCAARAAGAAPRARRGDRAPGAAAALAGCPASPAGRPGRHGGRGGTRRDPVPRAGLPPGGPGARGPAAGPAGRGGG